MIVEDTLESVGPLEIRLHGCGLGDGPPMLISERDRLMDLNLHRVGLKKSLSHGGTTHDCSKTKEAKMCKCQNGQR